jgi:hypothetical protein
MSNIAIGAEYVGTLAFGYLAIVYLMGQAPKAGEAGLEPATVFFRGSHSFF